MPKPLIRRAREVLKRQEPWLQHWDDLARVMLPRMRGFSENIQAGDSRVDEIYDGTPMRDARGLAHAIGMTRPDGPKWFFIRAEDEGIEQSGHDARAWLEDSENRLLNAMYEPRAQFRQAMAEVDLMLSVFGTGPFFVGENWNNDGFLYHAIPLKEAAIDWSSAGLPIGVYRFRRMTARQAENHFNLLGGELGEKAKRAISDKRYEEQFTYIHAVLPRGDRSAGPYKVFSREMPFAGMWVEEESEHIVLEEGFHEMPYMIPRMDTVPGEGYGRSPGMIALPDANTLQAMGETILVAGQRAADPPIMAPNDGSFSEANTFPGGITYYDVNAAQAVRGNPLFTMPTGANLPITRDMQRDVREQVGMAFFRDRFNLPVGGPEMTATEIIERREEFLREAGPLFSRLEAEYIAPLVERSFAIMLRAGGFAEIPPSLQGRNVNFEYESPLKLIREKMDAQIATLFKMEVAETAQINPDAIDLFDIDAYLRFQARANRVPTTLVRRAEDVDALRQARAKAQQEASQLAAAQQMAEAADKGASAIGKLGAVG